ncbi:MAG TPA: Calx-beta domain-containing protein [Thermoanaerobaculia bacterium]
MSRVAASAVLLVLLLGAASPGRADELQWRRLRPDSQLGPGDRFGAAVAVGGDVIAVGAYLADFLRGVDAGAVYLFRKTGGSWEPFLDSPIQVSPGDWLGFDVALDRGGRRLLVGAPRAQVDGVRCGVAYLYDLTEGRATLLERISPPDACQEGAEIGSAVAIDGDLMAVGARGADRRAGRVYASFGGGVSFERLAAPGLEEGAELGQSLAIDGQILIAGAPFANSRGPDSGAVYVFQDRSRTGSRLAPDTLRPGDAFGYAVSAEDGLIAVGAPQSDSGGSDSGAVYLRQGEGAWIQLAGRSGGDQLGVALALARGEGFAGARRSFQREGAVYPFSPGGLREPLHPPCPQAGAEFGFAVAARGSLLVVGAFLEAGTGAAYVRDELPDAYELSVRSPVSEAIGSLLVTVTQRDEPVCEPASLTLSTADRTAEQGLDYSHSPRRVTFPEGISTQEVRIPILQDALCEGDESFEIVLSGPPVSGSPDPALASRTVILRDDEAPSLVLTPSPLRMAEGEGEAALSVALGCQPVGPVTVSLRPDLGTVAPAQLRFTAADWNQPRTVQVSDPSLLSDARCGANAPYRIVATAVFPSGARVSRSVRVARINDDRRCVSGTQRVCTRPDGTVLYTVELSNAGDLVQGDLTTDEYFLELPDEVTGVWASADRGVATIDYAGNTVAWNGSIPPGARVATIEILTSLDLADFPETPVEAQGTLVFNRDGDAVLESALTDDPARGGVADPTVFVDGVPDCNAVSPPLIPES